ncbi:MAG TPA: hypothetical protein VFQ57_07545 [Sphingomonas sp.]|jgi:hypothetical protein|nr:hypothetical protein [Sphingomonas sp.]
MLTIPINVPRGHFAGHVGVAQIGEPGRKDQDERRQCQRIMLTARFQSIFPVQHLRRQGMAMRLFALRHADDPFGEAGIDPVILGQLARLRQRTDRCVVI